MYCCFSKLRTDDMTLRDIAELLEVSQNDIATAVGISKPTVNAYLNGTLKRQEILDKIYRYLNSREFYCGYSFMPTWQFAEFLNMEVLGIFRKSMKESEIAKAIGMTPQKFSKLKKCKDTSGITQKLDVYEQYNILEKFYNMCEDNYGFVPDKYKNLRTKLNNYVNMYDDYEIKNSFASLLNFIIDNGFRTELYGVLKKLCGIDYKDYQRIIQDDEFIMDLDVRYSIIENLHIKIGSQSYNVSERFEPILIASGERNYVDLFEGSSANDFTPIYKYPDILCRIILDHFYAFIDDPLYSVDNEYKKASVGWYNSASFNTASQRARIVEEYHTLSVNDKESVCKDISDKISKHMKNTLTDITVFNHEFDENGKLLLNSDCTLCCRELSDISDIIEIVSRIGPLTNLYTNFMRVPYNDEYLFDNRNELLNIMQEGFLHTCRNDWDEIIDKKLEFDAMDWNLWGLLTQALYIGRSIDDIYEYIIKLKNDKKHDFSMEP